MRQKGFTQVFILLGFLLAAGIVWMFYATAQAPGKAAVLPTPQVMAESVLPSPALIPSVPPSTVEEIEDEIIYTNNLFGYKVAVPKDWKIENSFIGTAGEAVFVPPSEQKKEAYRTLVSIVSTRDEMTKYPFNTEQDFQDWLTRATDSSGKRIYKSGNTTIDGYQAVKYITRALPGDQTEAYWGVVTWFRQDGRNFYIELGGDFLRSSENMGAYNKILASFKFVD